MVYPFVLFEYIPWIKQDLENQSTFYILSKLSYTKLLKELAWRTCKVKEEMEYVPSGWEKPTCGGITVKLSWMNSFSNGICGHLNGTEARGERWFTMGHRDDRSAVRLIEIWHENSQNAACGCLGRSLRFWVSLECPLLHHHGSYLVLGTFPLLYNWEVNWKGAWWCNL